MSVSRRAPLFICALLGVAAGVNLSAIDNSDFAAWAEKYHKYYDSPLKLQQAIETWKANEKIVKDINDGKASWWSAMNKFSDLSAKEFADQMLMRTSSIPKLDRTKELKKTFPDSNPSTFDWRTDGNQSVVTSVKDQGTVGSCWAFSTVGNIEGQWALAGHSLIDLSPEFLVDCDGTHDDNHADCSVFGGWPYLAYQFVIGASGLPSEADYPYCAGTGGCYPCMQGPVNLCGLPPPNCDKSITAACPNMVPSASISSWAAVTSDEAQIAAVLATQGPLSVLLDASQLQYYQSGVWDGHVDSLKMGCTTTSLDHAVLLVGYGSDNSSGEEVPYWSVKNSWGADWGEQGYFRIRRGVGMCGINTAVTTAIIN
jgi:cathepsin F